jgi:hypothetical protein
VILERTLRDIAEKMGKTAEIDAAIAKHPGDVAWLQTAISRAEAAAEQGTLV